MLVDACGRTIDYLRLSVTDRCDLRCTYCRPADRLACGQQAESMSFDEIERVARIFVALGVTRIRLTGGEPLARARFDELAQRIGRLSGLRDLSVSTNGTQLERLARPLREAGVRRLNVSLDTLSRERFRALTGRDALDVVLRGLASAARCGFDLIKINMVWLPELNGEDLEPMLEYCMTRNFVLRLIETMPVGEAARAHGAHSLQPLISRLRERYGLVDHLVAGGGPARYLASPDGRFSVGFITPLSQHFCDSCNRVRVSADGILHLCLGENASIDLRQAMRECDDASIAGRIAQALQHKPRQHSFNEDRGRIMRFMSHTGG